MKRETNYPSIDKTHLKGTKFLERNPIIPPLTFSQVMDLMFLTQGNHYVIDCLDLRVDVKTLQKDSLMLAKALLQLGVSKKDIVCVSMPNYYQAVLVFIATNMIGAVTTYLNPLAPNTELVNYLNMYNSKVLIDCKLDKEYHDYIKKNTQVKHIISMDEALVNSINFYQSTGSSIGYKDDLSFHELGYVSEYQKKLGKRSFGGKQDALILYTSGSTGEPKSLVFTNENLVASCIYLKNSTHVPKVTKDDSRWMNIVPFMYPYGYGASVLQTFLSGREVILTPNLTKDNISYYYRKNPHLVFGSPAHLEVTKRYLPKDQDLSSLKIYLSGGDFLSVQQSHDAIEYFKEHNANVSMCNSSGTGETLGCSTNAMNVPYRPETVGQLVVGPSYVVLDEETLSHEVKYDEEGILCTRGKHVWKGYYNNLELTNMAKINYDGKVWYKTGNLGSLGKDRYFTLVGRSSRFYITNTFNKVYCERVQNVLSNIDVVDSCAIVPKPNKDRLFESKAYVVLKDGYKEDDVISEYIINECKKPFLDCKTNKYESLIDYELPSSVTFLDTLPRTSADKVDYEAMKKWAMEEYNNENKNVKIKKKN